MTTFVVRVRPALNWWTDSYYVGPARFATRQLDGTMKYDGGLCHVPSLACAPRFDARKAWRAMSRLKRLGYPARIESPNEQADAPRPTRLHPAPGSALENK
jgi:hypothetical protein